jgi:hypothetical protein
MFYNIGPDGNGIILLIPSSPMKRPNKLERWSLDILEVESF